ncbi:hypothetical protein HYW46_03850 [Candidatus Daviesbacteria bacterium]|nr:hypothetical protein [Candidatus Daviesbacteria bacterium]
MGYFISNLWNAFSLLESREEAVIFLKELLTPTEIRMMAKRIQIAKMLLEGYKYDDIKTHVRVTNNTISSVNSKLQFEDGGGYLKIVKRLIQIESKRQDKLEGKKSIFDPGPYAGRKTTEWLLNKSAKKLQNYIKRKSVEKQTD